MTAGGGRLAWLWIPALWLLAFDWYLGPFSFTPVYLAIPLAALLGQRYGRRALWLVAIGGLPMLPPLVSYGFVSLSSAADVYAVALAVCALVVDGRRLAERVPRLGAPLFAAALAVLPMTMSVWGTELGQLRIGVVFGFTGLFWFLLFLLGWRGFPARRAVAALALAAAAGMWLQTVIPADGRVFFGGPQAELPLFGLTRMEHLWWDYRFDSPAAFLAGIAHFAAGRLWAAMLRTRAVPLAPRYAYRLVLLVAAIALGFAVNGAVLTAIGFDPRALPRYGFLLGAPLALPVTGLLGGLLLGRRGIAVAVLAVPVFWALDAFALSGFRLPLRDFAAAVHQPLAVLGFGLLGLAMRQRALGTSVAWRLRAPKAPALPAWAPWPNLAVARYAAFFLAALSVLFAGALALDAEGGIVAAAKALFQDRRDPPGAPRTDGFKTPGFKTAPHPLLWRAALEAAAQFPLVESDPARGRLVTGWRSDPASPEARIRIRISVGTELSPSALSLELERERRGRFGIWVRQGRYWDARAGRFAGADPGPERERVRSALFARALELEKALPKKSGSEP